MYIILCLVAKRAFIKVFFLVIVTRLGFLLLRQMRGFWWFTDVDGYSRYAQALVSGLIQSQEVRQYIFPGYSLLIVAAESLVGNWELSALLVAITGSLGGLLAVGSIFTLPVATLSIFFPPVLLWATSRIYSEGPMMAILYGSIWFWTKGRSGWAFLLAGLSVLVRPIGVCLLVAYIIFYLRKRKFRSLSGWLVLGTIPIVFLFYYNYSLFGNIFHNFGVYQIGETGLVPFLSIYTNLIRLVNDNGWRTLASGSFYLAFTSVGVVLLARLRKLSDLHFLIFLWGILQWLFLVSIGPAAFFEDFGRYASFLYPIVLWSFIQNRTFKISRLFLVSLWLGTAVFKNT